MMVMSGGDTAAAGKLLGNLSYICIDKQARDGSIDHIYKIKRTPCWSDGDRLIYRPIEEAQAQNIVI